MKHFTSLILSFLQIPQKKTSEIGLFFAQKGTSLIPPSTKGYKQSIGSVCSPHMAIKGIWWMHDISYTRLFHWLSLIQYLAFFLKLFGGRHGHSGSFSHFVEQSCSICFWLLISYQVVKSLHSFTPVNGWWAKFIDQLWWLPRAYVTATNVAIRSTQSFLQCQVSFPQWKTSPQHHVLDVTSVCNWSIYMYVKYVHYGMAWHGMVWCVCMCGGMHV